MGELEASEGVSHEEDEFDFDSVEGDTGAEDEQLAQASIIPEEPPEKDDAEDSGGESPGKSEVGEDTSGADGAIGKGGRLADLLSRSGIPAIWAFFRRNSHIVLGLGFGLGLITLSIVIKCQLLKGKDNLPAPPLNIYVTAVGRELTDIVDFRRFFILRPEKNKAYLSVDVSVKTPNEVVYREIQSNRARFRSIVYKSLQRTINERQWSSDRRDNLEKHILEALNAALSHGRAEAIMIHDWIEV